MTPRRQRRASRGSTWAALVVLAGCQEGKFETHGGLLLEITSSLRTCSDVGTGLCIDELEVWRRNLAGDRESLRRPLEARNIVAEPFRLALPASPLTESGESFLVAVEGLSGGVRLVAGSALLETDEAVPQVIGINMTEQFADCDVDADGFQSCACLGTAPCDCNDQNGRINPFMAELCTDRLDSNCDGELGGADCPPCSDTSAAPCSNAPLALAGVGACGMGMTSCEPSSGAHSCLGAGLPTAERADDGIDNDCDGAVDEGSSCTGGAVRDCFAGFVGAEARARARGVCGVGQQTCRDDVWEATCVGERRSTVVGAETACDGLDENCDGQVDEAAAFDTDGDGFTICGTCATPRQRAVVGAAELPPLDGDLPLLCSAAIDCDDDLGGHGAIVFPGQPELCTTPFDDDCRCDHDDPRFGGSGIGLPVIRLEGGTNCNAWAAGLHCGATPRSDPAPTGVCSEATPAPYYHGLFEVGGVQGCYLCGATYGLTCDHQSGRCATDVAAACTACDAPLPPSGTLRESTRPLCELLASGCRGTTAPAWQVVPTGEDPFGDCPTGQSCNGAGACQ